MKTLSLKKVAISLSALLLSFSPYAVAEVIEVYTWKAFPGKGTLMMSNMADAAAIHTAEGASVYVYAHNVGSTQLVDYVLRWDNRGAWGATKDKSRGSEKWVEFWAKTSGDPSGELVSSLSGRNLDASVKAESFRGLNTYGVWVWDPAPGKNAEVLRTFAAATNIHQSLGARVDSYAEGFGGTGNYHYLLSFKSWSDMAAFQDKLGSDPRWLELMSSGDPNNSTLVQSFSGQTISN